MEILTLALSLVCALPLPSAAHGDPAPTAVSAAVSRIDGRLPLAPSSFGAALAADRIYVFGGHLGQPHDYSREYQSGLLLAASTSDTTSWDLLSVNSNGVQGAALVNHKDRLVRTGGMGASNAAGEAHDLRSLDEVALFDPQLGVWSPLPSLPQGRSSHAAIACDGRVIVAGGWTLVGGDAPGEFATAAWSLDPEHPEQGWAELPGPTPRRGLALATLDGHALAIGGMNESGRPCATVEVFDAKAKTWLPAPDYPDFPFGVAAASLGSDVYACGKSGKLWRLSPGATAWAEVGALIYPRIFHQLVADLAHNELLAIGGAGSGQRVAPVERIALGSRPEDLSFSRLTVAAPLDTRNRQALHLDGDRLEFFGGNIGLEQHGFSDDRFSAQSWSFGLADLSWTRQADLPAARQSMGAVETADASMWLVGGFGPKPGAARSRNDVFTRATAVSEWRPLGTLPEPRSQFALHAFGKQVWLLGGLDYDASREKSKQFAYPMDVLRASAGENARFESSGLVLPRPRRAFGSALLDGRCYLIGGLAQDFEEVETSDVLDLEHGTWSTIPSPRRVRISPEVVAHDGRIFVIGGTSRDESDDYEPDRTIEVFDPATGAWEVCAQELPIDPTHARVLEWRGRLLLVTTHVTRGDVLELVFIETGAQSVSR